MKLSELTDEEWFELNVTPERAPASFGFTMPGLPPDDVQKGFTSQTGRPNLRQAFAFYRHVRERYLPKGTPAVMDFGAGWGRIARFFLRDTPPDRLWAVDPWDRAIECMRSTGLPCRVLKSSEAPPLVGLEGTKFDLVYAYSVFSHLNEAYYRAWLDELATHLAPGGVIVYTTRGLGLINYFEQNRVNPQVFGDYAELRRRYVAGEFQYFRDRPDAAALSGEHFGEAFVPRQVLERNPAFELLEFTESIPYVDGALAAIRKR